MRILGAALACLVLGGCASIAIPNDAEKFTKATSDYSDALKALQKQPADAAAATSLAALEGGFARGSQPAFTVDCDKSLNGPSAAFDAAVTAKPYDPAAVDKAFLGFRAAKLCSLAGLIDPGPEALKAEDLTTSKSSIDGTNGAPGVDTLGEVSKLVKDYSEHLVDLVTNKTGAGRDTATDGLITAGGSLLAATGLKNGAAAGGLLGQLISSIAAAERNRDIGKILTAYDAAMPTIMERVGHAGRLSTQNALQNREQAAQFLAMTANGLMADPKLAPAERYLVYKSIAPELGEQNEAISSLRESDPMQAARGFASAHHDLVAAFTGPKGQATASSAGLKAFSKAASDLHDAVKKD